MRSNGYNFGMMIGLATLLSIVKIKFQSTISKHMLCTIENNGGAFARLGKTAHERKLVFYTACVLTRLVLVFLLLLAAYFIPTTLCWISIVLGSLAFAFGMYFTVHHGCRWWRPFSLVVVTAAIIAVSVAYLTNKTMATPFLIGALVLAHLVSGVSQSIAVKPWN